MEEEITDFRYPAGYISMLLMLHGRIGLGKDLLM